ncbi:VQ domain-containing protein [Heracleum sosnowskyi]|uniref:VQ domain-containing protein n=1 Tax=Heracleum sosnowskyi TaxID=360622 RepID=A0AAD8J3Y5_9APIA|nr:VQ domain-containing protein [Heracleum sosnowskyi]
MSKKIVRISKRKSSFSKSTSHEKENLNYLVKVLKPRVYITHPCNFKSLVQELTGNEIASPPPLPISLQSSISSIISQPTDDQQVQVMQSKIIIDQDCYYGLQESSPEWSFERSCSDIINVPLTTWDSSEEFNRSTQILSNHIIDQFLSSSFGSYEDTSLVQYGDDLDYSWISEMNNPFVYHHGAPIMLAEVGEYAYGLSEML